VKVDGSLSERQADFPMSKYLTNPSSSSSSSPLSLGRNARMLGNQPPARSAAFQRQPDDSLFLRAVLEVILRRHFCVDQNFDARVGKIRNCEGDVEYLEKALQKLGFRVVEDHSGGVGKGGEGGKEANSDSRENTDAKNEPIDGKEDGFSDQQRTCAKDSLSSSKPQQIRRHELNAYLKQFSDKKRRLSSFFQLRTLLAPVIEAVIVLDRLAFLWETQDVVRAGILDIFDPVQSPRCYAVVGSK